MNKDEIYNKLIILLEKIGYFDIVKDDAKYEEFIQNLTLDQFKRILYKFNQFLRAVDIKDKGEYENPAIIANNYGIRQDLRDELLEEVLNNLKEIKDDKIRGAYVYYSLLRIHMFKDGNGRTSRLVNFLLNKRTDFEDFKEYFKFHESEELKEVDDTYENKMGIPDVRDIANMVKKSYDHILKHFGVEVPELEGKKILAYTTGYKNQLEYAFSEREKGNHSAMAPHKTAQIFTGTKYDDILDFKTKVEFACYLCDDVTREDNAYNYGGIISTILFYRKGILDKYIDSNNTYYKNGRDKFDNIINRAKKRFVYDETYIEDGITKEEFEEEKNKEIESIKKLNSHLLDTSEFWYNYNNRNKTRFDDFSPEDFDEFIKIGDEIKRMEFGLIGETFKDITDINDIEKVYDEKVKSTGAKSL